SISCTCCDSYQKMYRRQMQGLLVEGGVACFLGLLTPQMLYAKPKGKTTADSVILLWMGGGMSHLDTFDPHPDVEWGGKFKAIKTAAEGIQTSEHFPKLA